MLRALAVAVGAVAVARAAVPPSSTRVVGNLRIQTLSPTLVRVEAKGSAGFEDRETFMVVNRSMNTGVPITAAKVQADGSTHLTTAHYTVVVPKQQQRRRQQEAQAQVVPLRAAAAKKNSTCSNVRSNTDGSGDSKRISKNAVRATPTKEARPVLGSWAVFKGPPELKCDILRVKPSARTCIAAPHCGSPLPPYRLLSLPRVFNIPLSVTGLLRRVRRGARVQRVGLVAERGVRGVRRGLH